MKVSLVAKLLLIISPAILYVLIALVRHSRGLWLQNPTVASLIISLPLIVSVVLYYFAVVKKNDDPATVFRVWLPVSAIVSVFVASLFDGLIFMWTNISRFSQVIIYAPHILYLGVVIYFVVFDIDVLLDRIKTDKEVSK